MTAHKTRILVVDDERDICRALEFLLSREGYDIQTAPNGAEALKKFEKHSFDLVLTDLRMEGMDGMALLERIKSLSPETVVVLMTAYGSVENAVEAMKRGAADYIVKPFVNDDVKLTVRRLLEHHMLVVENQALRRQLSNHFARERFVGDSPQVMEMLLLLERISPTKSNVLILGESGTGKSLVAEMIHANSPRRDKCFMSINCSAIPETLLESELFGYKKGAFTGAGADKEGLMVYASGGTLFMDEIGDMPLSLQAKLLKVIETGLVTPLGDTKVRSIDVRLIAATHRDLEELAKEGKFREDLYYRLDVIEFTLPALRDRKADIPLIVEGFLGELKRTHSKHIEGVDEEAMAALSEYAWPGNVRELRNVLERMVVLCAGSRITMKDIPKKVLTKDLEPSSSLKDSLYYYERRLIMDRLTTHQWDKEETAKELGIDLATLYRKMKKLGITGG